MRNILVTGGSGFIGKNLVKGLTDNGDNVYILVHNNKLNGKFDSNLIKYVYCDSKDLCEIDYLPQMDVCYNLAAYGVNYSNQDINQMINTNITFLIDIINFAKKNNTKLLIHTGTCFEYGFVKNNTIKESSALNPQSLYGVTKMAGVNIGNIYAKHNKVNMITVRPFGIYGPGENMNKLVPSIINSGISNTKLKMTEGNQIRDYLFIDDLIDAYVKLGLSNNLQMYEQYNVCSSKAISISEFCKKIINVCGFNKDLFEFGAIDYRENEVMRFVGDNTKVKNTIDWIPKTTLDEGIKKAFNYYRQTIIECNEGKNGYVC